MRLTWGVVTLRKIVMNMHTWASRLLKPRIQVCVLQALTMPFVCSEIAPPTPDVDIASSKIFNTPVLVARSNSSDCSTGNTPPLRVDGYGSSDVLDGRLMGVLSHPVSPSPLTSRISRQRRPLAIPRRRLSPATPPTHGITLDVVCSHTTSSGLLANTNEEQATTVSMTSPAIAPPDTEQATKKAEMNCLIRSLESIQLGDPAPGKNASSQATSPFCDEELKNHVGEHAFQGFHTRNSNAEGSRRGIQSAVPAMQSVPLLTAPPISTFSADDTQHVIRTANNETLEMNAPYSKPVSKATERRQENEWRREKPVSLATHRTMSDPPPKADSNLGIRPDNLDARRLSCFQYLVEYKGRLLKMIESLDSLRDFGQEPSPRAGVQDKSEGSTPRKYLFAMET